MGTKVKIVIGIVVVVVLVVVAVALLGGGDDDEPTSGQTSTTKSDGASGGSDSDSDAAEPTVRTVATKRAVGRNAATNVGVLMRSPGEIYIRVSAAPKQEVTVNWTLACGVGSTSQGSYDATPPDTRQLELPKKKPKTCVASTSSQIKGEGRLKLAILRDG